MECNAARVKLMVVHVTSTRRDSRLRRALGPLEDISPYLRTSATYAGCWRVVNAAGVEGDSRRSVSREDGMRGMDEAVESSTIWPSLMGKI